MMCPVLTITQLHQPPRPENRVPCVEQDCAWFDNYRETCVVKILGVELRAVAMAIREASGHLAPKD